MFKLWKKEFRTYFLTPAGYIFTGTFLLLSGVFFSITNLLQNNAIYSSLLQNITLIFILIIPILTMKMISEETRNKTDQLLLTSPLKVKSIVLGKYLGAVSVYFISLSLTFIYPYILSKYSDISLGEIAAGYVGIFFMGTAFIAIGLFISSLTENQVIAAIVTFGMLLFIYILEMVNQVLPTNRKAGIIFAVTLALFIALIIWVMIKNILVSIGSMVIELIVIAGLYFYKKEVFDGLVVRFFGWFSLINRYETFAMGILDINSVIYYLSFTAIFIFLTIQIIEKRRWS